MKHGHAPRSGTSPTYRSWSNMMTRCYNPNAEKYESYGGVGVTVQKSWHKFENFLKDMGERPVGMTIDRKEPLLGYSKKNCRWATIGQQARNKRNTIRVEYKGETKTLMEWSEILGKEYDTLHDRIFKKGWSVQKAFEKSVGTLTVAGVTKTYKEWSDSTGLHTECIRGRVKMGWAPEKCIQVAVGKV